jgi:hypothetical protein
MVALHGHRAVVGAHLVAAVAAAAQPARRVLRIQPGDIVRSE